MMQTKSLSGNRWLDAKLSQADVLRRLGNKHFKEGFYSQAIAMYDTAITSLNNARDSAENKPLYTWNEIQVVAWLHKRIGVNVALAFASCGIDGRHLATMTRFSDITGVVTDPDVFVKDSIDAPFVLACIQQHKREYNTSFGIAINQQRARVLSNRSLAKGKLNNALGAMEDAGLAVHFFPEWGKAYYRLGQCQLKLACLREPNNFKMLENAKKTFLQGSVLSTSEYTGPNDFLTLDTMVRTCVAKLAKIMDEVIEELKYQVQEGDQGQTLLLRESEMDVWKSRAPNAPPPSPPPPPTSFSSLSLRPPIFDSGGGCGAGCGCCSDSAIGSRRLPPGEKRYRGGPSVASSSSSVVVNDVSILGLALKDDHLTLIAKLKNGSSPNSCNQMGQSALHIAALWNAVKCGTLLIQFKANVNALNGISASTPLMMAAQRNHSEFVRLLLKNGANPLIEDKRGMFAFNYAEDEELRQILGGPVSTLFDAVNDLNLDQVKSIAREHPELVAAENIKGNTCLNIALSCNSFEISMFFILHRLSLKYVNFHDNNGNTPLHIACQWEDEQEGLQLVAALLKVGALVNYKSFRMDEYHGGNYDKLSTTTGEKEHVSSEHRTPLFEAVEIGNVAIVECLLEKHDIDVNVKDGDGCTPLYVAFDEEEFEIAEMLLQKDADPNIGNMDIGAENTLLAWLCSRKKISMVQLLLKYNADTNVPGKSGFYPLHMAARSGSKVILEMLLGAGADPAVKDSSSGKTPVEIARQNKKSVEAGCVQVLQKATELLNLINQRTSSGDGADLTVKDSSSGKTSKEIARID